MEHVQKGAVDPDRVKRYVQALLAGDPVQAAQAVDQAMRERQKTLAVYLGLLHPAMREIGEQWCRGEINAAEEHRATEITLAQMEKLRRTEEAARPMDLSVTVACVEGERHFLGALMVADAFRFQGWRVDFLGADVPARDLVDTLKKQPPHALALSVTLKPNLAGLRKIMAPLNRDPERPLVLAGGAALKGEEALARKLRVEIAEDPLDGIRIADRLLRPADTRSTLETFLRQLGARIREWRIERGWSQQELAEAASLDRTYILAIEHGKQNLTLGVLFRLAEALGISVGRLIE